VKAVFLKLGGSVITDKTKPYTLQPKIVQAIANEIAQIRAQQPDLRWFIGNGAGSFGHYAVHASKWRQDPSDPKRIAQVRLATSQLSLHVLTALRAADIPATICTPAAFMTDTEHGLMVDAAHCVGYAEQGVVPLVYGDVVHHRQHGSSIVSTEPVLDALAQAWIAAGHEVQATIYCTNVDGVLDKNSAVLSVIESSVAQLHFTTTKGYDVTGGMQQKVAAGFKAAAYSQQVRIINGTTIGALSAAILDEQGGTHLVT
jgi:isopentenyl phosphate kinase